MKKKMNLLRLLPALVAAGSLVVAGCTDNNYDLGNLDTTVAFGSADGLALPGNNSTHEMILDDVLDIGGSDCIVLDKDSNYVFLKEDTGIKPTKTKVNAVSVNTGSGITDIPFVIPAADLGITASSSFARGNRKKSFEGLTELKETITTFDFLEENLSGDIVDLKYADMERAPISLEVSFSKDLQDILTKFSGLMLQLPNFLLFQDNKLSWRNGSNSGTVDVVDGLVTLPRDIMTKDPFILEGNVVKLDFETEDKASENDPTQTEHLDYTRTKTGKDAKGRDTFEGTIDMNGFVDIVVAFDPANVDYSDYDADDLAHLDQKSFVINSELKFGASYGSETKIVFKSVTGEFKPTIDFTIDPVEVSDVPEFLDDDDVTVNLHDMKLELNVASTMPLGGKLTGKLRSYFKGSASAPVTIKDIEVKANQTSKILISQLKPSSTTGYTQTLYSDDGTGKSKQVEGNLNSLISHIPDSITFVCEAETVDGEVATIELDKDFTLSPSYKFTAPLALDSRSIIVYRDTIDNWNKDIEDLNLSEGTRVEVTMDVDNKVPLGMHVEAWAIDVNGKDIPKEDIDVTVDRDIVGGATTIDLKVTVTQKNKKAFKRLDGLRLKAQANSSGDGVTLNAGSRQTLKLNNIRIKLYGMMLHEDKD